MNGIDRRTAVIGTAAALAALAIPTPLLALGPRPALFVFDGRIARARESAAAFRAAGVALLDRERHDLGQAWHSGIPSIVRERGGSIAGLTLWVDSYICETFGRERGLTIRREAVRPGGELHAWVLG